MSSIRATYERLPDGDWGVRILGGVPRPGQEITVAKKSGEQKTESITRVVWCGDGVALCAIKQRAGQGG